MFGKLLQLRRDGISQDGFVVTDTIDCGHTGRHYFKFGVITFKDLSPNATKNYICGGYEIEKKSGSPTKIIVSNGELSNNDKEEYLLVIITMTNQLVTTAKKTVCRYDSELTSEVQAIIEMHNGDTVEVSINPNGDREIYKAVQIGNEMFLVKKSR